MSDEIVNKVFELYESLGKNGKPAANEWTCLAAFILEDASGGCGVVSMATGTKCVGGNAMVIDGTVVFDSHAEVLARRNFLRYLYGQLEVVKNGGGSAIVELEDDKKFRIIDGAKIHFYTSQLPCGDASIVPTNFESDQESIENDELPAKKAKFDVHRTGAKPVKSDPRQDPKGGGAEYHARGAVRIKPGRGDPTKSLSCSDKIAKWIYCGLQGALLSLLITEPIELSSIIIGGAGPFDRQVLESALVGRSGLNGSESSKRRIPTMARSPIVFKHSAEATGAKRPCAASIGWADVEEKKLEVSVEGRCLGATKKSKKPRFLTTSKRSLFCLFSSVYGASKESAYGTLKKSSAAYEARKKEFVQKMGSWSDDKTEFDNFKID
ncbi:adenosine deaminase [Nesidiocoris tenuis]|uniref:tRNA-specific adenosine deaminase 1 n=1 Tax=Nesidiocoris tenuis TaxID=355587 RepID=A0ABN7B5M7_9HEMI|nr:adenosine deaminase [Nesidiocoris tenuis]